MEKNKALQVTTNCLCCRDAYLMLFFVALSFPSSIFPNLSFPSWKVVGLRLGDVLELRVRSPNVSLLLSVLCHFVALADCIRSGYVGGQFVITRNTLSFSFLHHNYIGSPSEFNYYSLIFSWSII